MHPNVAASSALSTPAPGLVKKPLAVAPSLPVKAAAHAAPTLAAVLPSNSDLEAIHKYVTQMLLEIWNTSFVLVRTPNNRCCTYSCLLSQAIPQGDSRVQRQRSARSVARLHPLGTANLRQPGAG
jgi:hypothetical protein